MGSEGVFLTSPHFLLEQVYLLQNVVRSPVYLAQYEEFLVPAQARLTDFLEQTRLDELGPYLADLEAEFSATIPELERVAAQAVALVQQHARLLPRYPFLPAVKALGAAATRCVAVLEDFTQATTVSGRVGAMTRDLVVALQAEAHLLTEERVKQRSRLRDKLRCAPPPPISLQSVF